MAFAMGVVLPAVISAVCFAVGAELCFAGQPPSPSSQPASSPGGAATGPATQPAGQLDPPKDREFKASYDGSVQKYVICLPKGFDASQPHDVLIAFHGHSFDRWQYVNDPRVECKAAQDAAARHGMIFVCPDYRAPAGWMGPAAEADTVQLIALLKKLYKVGKVVLHGGSMGGTSVLTFAVLHGEMVDAVSSQNGTANLLEYEVNYVGIQDAIKDAFGGRKDETPQQYKKRNPDEYKKRSAEFHPDKLTMPVALMVGGKDDIVPPQSIVRLAKAIRKHNRAVLLLERPNLGHESTYEDASAILDFAIDNAHKNKPPG